MLRQKKIFLQPAFHSYPKILFLPIFLGCQNKWKCFIVINGVLVTQWMLLGIQPITEDDIFRKPHHILFWLYADMLNFGKKVMKFSQLHRHACVHIDTRVERERERWLMILLLEGNLSPEKSSIAWHLLDGWSSFAPGWCDSGISSAGASLWSPRPPSAVWHCVNQQPLQGR